MKNVTSRFIPLAVLSTGLAVACFTGCSKSETKDTMADAKDSVKDAYADTKAAMAKGWDDIKGYTFDKKNDFTTSAKAVSSKMDVQLSELRTNYSEAKASASRKAAMEELKSSEADYHQKLDALGNATADTWDSAKKNVMLAWDRMQAAYYKARAD